MNNSEAVRMLADEIRKIYQTDTRNAESAIKMRVAANCIGMSNDGEKAFLMALLDNFKASQNVDSPKTMLEENLPKDTISRLLGKDVSSGNLSSQEMLEKLSVALYTLFSTLNRIVKTIDETLMAEESGNQTIRGLIGSQIDGIHGEKSIEDYLGRIEKAFLLSHQAFRQAAHTIFRKVLDELNPDAIANSAESRFRFGPMRKAELYDIYETRFTTLKKWFESGRFMKDFLREFESYCQHSP